jgi:cysteine desulfurase/selenocysteine lyase
MAAPSRSVVGGLDTTLVRSQFPILTREVNGKKLVYLDNAATTQKPASVIEAVTSYYELHNANVHRGVHFLSESATRLYEESRDRARRFVNAEKREEMVFVRGTTEAINLVAHAFVRPRLADGDTIVISAIEHHSNIVPWQMICEETGATLRIIPVNDDGTLDLGEYERLVAGSAFVALTHVSNALGTVNPVRKMVEIAHAHEVPVLLDGAQAVPHMPVDVRDLGCEFYAFSGHKMYGPTGIGVLYGKASLLQGMKPYQGGGDMIASVSFEKTSYAEIPYKFEAGTPDIAGAVGLGAAIAYLEATGLDQIAQHEHNLLTYATAELSGVPGLTIIGTAPAKAGVVSFVMDGVHPHDIGTIVDAEGIAIRTGHHCAQPVMTRFGVPATARASFGLYNTREEIDLLVSALDRVIEVMR